MASFSLIQRHVLVVEDEFLIARDLQEILLELGARRVSMEMSVGAALAVIQVEPPDCAVLDYKLGAGTVEPLAEALRQRRVPFVLMTGYSDSPMIATRFPGVQLVGKPISVGALTAALQTSLACDA